MDAYERAGYGLRQVQWGNRAAVIAVDFQLAFTSPDFPMGRSDHLQRAVVGAQPVLEAARSVGALVIHTAVAWASEAEFGHWKTPSLVSITPDSPAAQTDPRVLADSDLRIVKRAPSALFGTDLSAVLRTNDVDTVTIIGVTTSGCVRATAVDAFSYGFRTFVVEDACGDQDPAAHHANLRDIELRYAEVINSGDAAQLIARNTASINPARERTEP